VEGGWKVHRDLHDPEENPLGHIIFDAPEVLIAGIGAILSGIASYLLIDCYESEKNGEDRRWWVPLLGAIAFAALAGIAFYVLAAFARVALGVG
jgi:hypothetical protein